MTEYRADLWVRFCGFFKSRRGLYPSTAGKSPRPQTKEQMTRRQQRQIRVVGSCCILKPRHVLHRKFFVTTPQVVPVLIELIGSSSGFHFSDHGRLCAKGRHASSNQTTAIGTLPIFGKDGNGCRLHNVQKPSSRFRNTLRPWNKGRLLVKKRPLQPKQARAIHPRLELART